MTSRKRNKGKERKAKKAELEAERIEQERGMTRKYGWVGHTGKSGRVKTQCNHGVDLVIPDGQLMAMEALLELPGWEASLFHSKILR